MIIDSSDFSHYPCSKEGYNLYYASMDIPIIKISKTRNFSEIKNFKLFHFLRQELNYLSLEICEKIHFLEITRNKDLIDLSRNKVTLSLNAVISIIEGKLIDDLELMIGRLKNHFLLCPVN